LFGKDKRLLKYLLIWVSVGFNSSGQELLISFAEKHAHFTTIMRRSMLSETIFLPQKYREFVYSWIYATTSIVDVCRGVSPEHINKLAEIK
jgi:S-methylmethionine-dependent homocysteine/selenocysteine methylase